MNNEEKLAIKIIEEFKRLLKEDNIKIPKDKIVDLIKEYMFKFCWICGKESDLTGHHYQLKKVRGNSDGKGKICLCRGCHDIIEGIRDAIMIMKKEKGLSITSFKKLRNAMESLK